MCKLLIIPGLKKDKHKIAWKFIHNMADEMSVGNMDGLGYAAIDHNGNLFGEHWLYNTQAFINREEFTKPKKRDPSVIAELKQMLCDFVTLEDEPNYNPVEKYNTFGTVGNEIAAITLHTRAASNTVCLKNVHPFVDEDQDVSVIHNGFIRNHTTLDEIRSTCDSERILNMYIEHEVNKVPADIQNMIDDLKGVFACGIFSRDGTGQRVLDVFRTRANLSAAYIKELETIVISTAFTDIKEVCNSMGLTIVSKAESVKEDTLLRLNPITGKPLLTLKYKDTTHYSEYNNTSAYGHHYRSGERYNTQTGVWEDNTGYESEWRKWEREKEEERKKKNNNNVVAMRTEADHQGITQEEQNLMDKGYSLEGAREHIRNQIKEVTNDPTEVNKAAVEEINKVNQIIQRTVDPLNEEEAALDDWFQDHNREMWIKKIGGKH